MRFRILGPVELDGGPVNSPQERRLLALLVVHRNAAVAVDRMVDTLWEQDPPASAKNSVLSKLSRLRALLPAGALSRVGGGYRLQVDDDDCDADVFARLVQSGRGAEPAARRIEHLSEAISLFRGPVLGDVSTAETLRPVAVALERARDEAEELRLDCLLAIGDYHGVLSSAESILAEFPFREQIVCSRLKALARLGRRVEALRELHVYRSRLADDTGLDPGAGLRLIESTLLIEPDDDDPPAVSPADDGSPAAGVDVGPALASRTSTFLFSDLEHSTALWEQFPNEMNAALADHERILRDAFAAEGGTVFAHTGDGLAAAFPRAASAIAAAIRAQAAHQSHDWGVLGALAVRLGMHTGDVFERDGNFFGPPLNLASRLVGAAYGGQILVTELSLRLAKSALPGDAWFDDLGSWFFDGVSHPERVFQVRHPSLRASPSRLRSGRRAVPGLPVPAGRLAGRTAELLQVRDAIGEHRLVTLTGPGGVGKTRLALEVAAASGDQFPDGARFVDLARVSDAASVAPRLAEALGVRYPANSEDLGWVAAAMADAQVLVVLDNCEHLADTAAAYAAALLTGARGVRVLATSRQSLRVPGEEVVIVAPLPVGSPGAPGDAVELLVARGRAAGGRFAADDPELQHIANAVDGLPLALELLAPRLAHMKPAELGRFLAEEGASAAAAGRAQETDRQATLDATFASSYGLLPPDARRFLATMSVCPGGVAMEAGEHLARVAGLAEGRGRDLLVLLAERSLVNVDTSGPQSRYRMLQPIREFASARLREWMSPAAARSGYARYLATWLRSAALGLRGSEEALWAAKVDAEFDNIRAAVGWCEAAGEASVGLRIVTALVDHLLARQRFEIADWALRMAALDGAGNEPEYPLALGLAAHAAMETGRLADADRLSQASIAAETRLGMRPLWITRGVTTLLAAANHTTADVRTELRALRDAASGGDDLMGEVVARFDRVMIVSFGPHPEAALVAAREIEALGRVHANPSVLSMGLLGVGLAMATVDPPEALKAFREAHRLADSVGNVAMATQAARGLIERETGDDDPAAALSSLANVLRRFVEDRDVSQQEVTVMAMLPLLLALDAVAHAATICGALTNTVWARAAKVRDALIALDRRGDEAMIERARRVGTRMALSEMVRFALEAADQFGPKGAELSAADSAHGD